MIGLLILSLVSSLEPLSYGEVYRVDTHRRDLPVFLIQTGYAIDLTDSFNDIHVVEGSAQVRLWKYLGLDLLYQRFFPKLSASGRSLRTTEPVLDIQIPQPLWSLFAQPKIQILVGDWNFFNAFPIEVDLLLGGGVGIIKERNDIDQEGKFKVSGLWSVEQRLRLFPHSGLYLRFVGHRSGSFVGGGLSLSF